MLLLEDEVFAGKRFGGFGSRRYIFAQLQRLEVTDHLLLLLLLLLLLVRSHYAEEAKKLFSRPSIMLLSIYHAIKNGCRGVRFLVVSDD